MHVNNFSERVQYLKTTSNEARHTLGKLVHAKCSFFLFYMKHPRSDSTSTEPFLHIEVEIQTLEIFSNGKTEVLVSLGKRRDTFYTEVSEEQLTTLMMEVIMPDF